MGNINLQGGGGRFGMLTADEEAPVEFVLDDEEPGMYDPGAHTVDEVNAYLDDADPDEYNRVLDAERAGKARVGIVG